MYLLFLIYKRIDHHAKEKSHDMYMICFKKPPTEKDMMHIKDLIYDKEKGALAGYELHAKKTEKKEMEVMIGTKLEKVKCLKECMYIYTKGGQICDYAVIHGYKYVEGTFDRLLYENGELKLKKDNHAF